MPRSLRYLLGTALVAVLAFVVWTTWRPAGSDEAGRPLVASNDAAAEVLITPGPRRAASQAAGPAVKPTGDRKPASGSQPAALNASKGSDGVEETWSVIYLEDPTVTSKLPTTTRVGREAGPSTAERDSQRIGWSRSTTQQIKENGRPIVRTKSEITMQFKRFGQTVNMQKLLTTDETLDGSLIRYRMEIRNPPAGATVTKGTVDGTELRVETEIAGKTQTSQIAWDAEVKSPAWQERILKSPPLKPGDKRTFKSFLPDFNKIATVKMTADDVHDVKLLDGKPRSLLKVRVTNSVTPDMTTRAWLDDKGETLRTDDDMLGKLLTVYTVSKEEALKKLDGADLDLAAKTMVETAPIPQPYKTQRVVYRVSLLGDDPAKYLSVGETQSVKSMSPNVVELTVTAPKKPADLKPVPIGDEFTRATPFLQINDKKVQEHARQGSLGEKDPLKVAVLLEQYVHRKITKKSFSTALASAAEVAKSLVGDCTEHAVLLAALLRARGIPSRVAVGLVYVDAPHSFGGHMWTEAWLGGHWYPLDATLGQGTIGATHIKLGDSALSEDAPSPVVTFLPLIQVLGKIGIQVIEAK